MRIKMDESTLGSRDGSVTEMFLKDQEYDVPSSLGLVFVETRGVAHEVEPPPEEEESAASGASGAGPSEGKEGEIVEWPLATKPLAYLEKWPNGPKADLARAFLEQEAKKAAAVGPSETSEVGPSESKA